MERRSVVNDEGREERDREKVVSALSFGVAGNGSSKLAFSCPGANKEVVSSPLASCFSCCLSFPIPIFSYEMVL